MHIIATIGAVIILILSHAMPQGTFWFGTSAQMKNDIFSSPKLSPDTSASVKADSPSNKTALPHGDKTVTIEDCNITACSANRAPKQMQTNEGDSIHQTAEHLDDKQHTTELRLTSDH
ncbi:hypothetical protein [Aliiglaciecola sp. LCG003]|uniref:hypothetical protein n=1 Tax=Aliiglaciecola sp. LCG003 TaxID=3053655 RepID=UPI002573B66A|nr:hypothetical protein [Aliiglaciecola sp. LCG003]WJG10120.1 hypothetical protein QR722_03515 [Aliiglaciecola sp. LCG003]